MDVVTTELPGLLILQPRIFSDARGFFFELANRRTLHDCGIESEFVQDNLSRSSRGTLRGLHYQIEQTQGKLVTCLAGCVVDVAVDLRRSSPTFGQHAQIELSEDTHRMAYIPPGFAHGFCVVSESADFFYKCNDYYAPQHERTLLWNDPALAIDWPTDRFDKSELTLSSKDEAGTPLSDCKTFA